MRSRVQLAGQLAERAGELERERAAYAHEAVRYERARIAGIFMTSSPTTSA